MKHRPLLLYFTTGLIVLMLVGCQPSPLERAASHYQLHQDLESLKQVMQLLPEGLDTTKVKQLLGKPIDFGFDYRYLTTEIGEQGCVIGAVFHLDNDLGQIHDYWLGEICE